MLPQPFETWGGFSMAWKSRGAALTIFALLIRTARDLRFRQAFFHDPGVGFVS